MSTDNDHARALGFTVVALSVALEEALKALAEKHGKQPGEWLEELQDVALFRAQAHLNDRAAPHEAEAAQAAIAVAAHIFAKTKNAYTSAAIE